MEWFFTTTEGILPRTSIMVGRNTYSSVADLKLPVYSWKGGKCGVTVVRWSRSQEMGAFQVVSGRKIPHRRA